MHIQALINWAKTLMMPLNEVHIVLAHLLQKDRAFLYAWPEYEVSDAQVSLFKQAMVRRQLGEPIAYILGYREFWSEPFKVTPATLIPRHETELVIEVILDKATDVKRMIDLGTGSGIIACTLAKLRPTWQVLAIDNSLAALSVAQYNADQMQLTNIEFKYNDWLTNLECEKVELIVSNPPYLSDTDEHLMQGDLCFEPKNALSAGASGLEALTQVIEQATHYLVPNGLLVLEHGFTQSLQVQDLLAQHQFQQIQTWLDLNQHPRVTVGWLNSNSIV